MSRPPAIEKRTSSGGVIFRVSGENAEVALVLVRGRAWCLPKGGIDSGEDAPAAALREVREETGLNGTIVGKIGDISYWYYLKGKKARVNKRVHFYLMQYEDGSTEDHDHEVDEARWFTVDEAVGRLTYKSERAIMLKAVRMIQGLRKRKGGCLKPSESV
jgi:8-oxo-dGTP pyrophosphatase MutT (NUDIX family)